MLNQARSRIFVVSMFLILALSTIAIYYVATQATQALNIPSIDTQQRAGSADVAGDGDLKEVVPTQNQAEAAQFAGPSVTQRRLPDLAPTLVDPSVNSALRHDLAPTLTNSSRGLYSTTDLAPTIVNPLLGVYSHSDLAPTLVREKEGADRLPDLAPTIVESQDSVERLPDLAPTLP